jgi:hypothetical protein
MTPDRWHVMTLHLSGEPPPPPPPIPGRQHRAPPGSDDDPYAAAWDARTKPAELIDADGSGNPD